MPWKKQDNPFYNSNWANNAQPEKKPEKERFIPDTMVDVWCVGCERKGKRRKISVRVRKEDRDTNGNGRRTLQCRKCLWVMDVQVFSSGDVTVFQQDQHGQSRQQTEYERVYQE